MEQVDEEFYVVQVQIDLMGEELDTVHNRIDTVAKDMRTAATSVENLHFSYQLLQKFVAHFRERHSNTTSRQEGRLN